MNVKLECFTRNAVEFGAFSYYFRAERARRGNKNISFSNFCISSTEATTKTWKNLFFWRASEKEGMLNNYY